MEHYRVSQQPIAKPTTQWYILLAIAAAFTIGQAVAFCFLRPWLSVAQTPAMVTKASVPTQEAVTALGRLEPQGEVIKLSISNNAQSSRIAQLLVKQGDKVRTHQVVAILDSQERLLTALEQAQEQVKVAQARLLQVKAGAKPMEITAQQANINSIKAQLQGEINAQQATIARLEPELGNAQTEYRRYQELYQTGAISVSNLDSKRLAVESVRGQINEAKASLNRTEAILQQQTAEAKGTLNQIKEVRPVDVREAQAEVNKAIVEVREAQANLDSAYVRSPINGQILKIHTRPGEAVSEKGQGIVELGQTEQMYVVAEVYESDIGKVHLGQRATLTSDGNTILGLHGTVNQIGLQVGKKDVLDNDPAADADARVVEVKIRLDSADSLRVASLTNMKMRVFIQI